MTTELDRLHRRAGNGHWDQPADGAPRARENPPLEPDRTSGSHARHRARLLDRNPAWPIVALLAGYPLWWVLGIADYMFVFLAFPMAWRLYTWHRRERRQLRLPPGFSLWLLFLAAPVAAAAGILALAAVPGLHAGRGADALAERSWHDRQPGLQPDHLLRRAGDLLRRCHHRPAVRGKPDRARAAPPPAGLAARPASDLRCRGRPRRSDRPALPVHRAARVRGAAWPPAGHEEPGNAPSRPGAAPGRPRRPRGAPERSLRFHEYLGQLPGHPDALAAGGLVGGRHPQAALDRRSRADHLHRAGHLLTRQRPVDRPAVRRRLYRVPAGSPRPSCHAWPDLRRARASRRRGRRHSAGKPYQPASQPWPEQRDPLSFDGHR